MQRYQYFYPGQVVTLSGGDQRMTVKPTSDEESNDTCCVWFNPELGGHPVQWTFPSSVLKLEENQDRYGYGHTRFNPGDAVQLRGGGPSMAVVSTQRTNDMPYVSCIWLDQDNREPLTASFPSEMLVAV